MGVVYYDIDAFFYKEYREFYCRFKNEEWWLLSTKEIIYYTHWANAIMSDFLESDKDLLDVAKNIKIKSIDEYFSSKSLF
jgi:hypothetical protein